MKNYFLKATLLILSICLLSIGCRNEKDAPIQIETEIYKEMTLDEEASNRLFMLYPTASASKKEELIALTNFRNPPAVTLIDYDGNFVEQVGSEGRGPKEYQLAIQLGFDSDDNIIVRDNMLALIKRFIRKDNSVEAYDDVIKESINIASRNLEQCGDKWYLGINKYEQSPFEKKETIGVFDNEFNLLKSFGNFDLFFEGRKSVLEDPIIVTDCENQLIFTTHYKVPFLQVYSFEDYSKVKRIDHIPPSFNLSDKFKSMVTDRQAHTDYLVNEQSMSILLALNEKYLYHFFRNEAPDFQETLDLLSRDFYVAVYSRDDYSFIGEKKINGVPLGTTKEDYIIMLKDNNPLKIQLVEIAPKE